MSFGSDDNGFNEFTKAYKREPSIENYVKMRRENPEAEIEIAILGGIEPLTYMESELRRYGIDPLLAASVMDADIKAIDELSLQLLERMIEANKLSQAGETQLTRRGRAIPGKLIDWLINCSLDALSWNDDLYLSRDLIVLIRERLGGSNPEYLQASRAHEKKRNAASIAGQLKVQGVNPTYKMLGEILDVAPSTVKRWFEPGEFERETAVWARIFSKDDKLFPSLKRRK